jgi:hypothetical protein
LVRRYGLTVLPTALTEQTVDQSGSYMAAKVIQKPKKKTEKLKLLYDYLSDIRNEKFTGYIKVNFTQGNIGRVEKFEEILKKIN